MPTHATPYSEMTTQDGLCRLSNTGLYVDWSGSYIDDLPLDASQALLRVYLSCTLVWEGKVGVRCGCIRLSDCPYLAHVPASKNSLWRFEVSECEGFDQATVVCQTYEMDALCSAAHCARAVKTFGYGRGRFASINVVGGQLVLYSVKGNMTSRSEKISPGSVQDKEKGAESFPKRSSSASLSSASESLRHGELRTDEPSGT